MDFEFINPLSVPGWDELVLTAGDYSFFHSSAWIRVLCDSYGYRPAFFAMTEKGNLSAVIPLLEVNSFLTGKRAVSLPFSDYCEPLVFTGPPLSSIPEALIGAAKKAGWKRLDLRGQNVFPPETPVWSRYAGHRLKLSNPGALRAKLHKNTVRNLKKAEASGIEIEILDSFEATREYYRLHCLTRKRQAAPPQPFHFFRKIQEHVLSKGGGMVVLARYGQKAVAGGVFFHFGRKAMYKFGALDMNFAHTGASAAVMWKAISHYASEGCDSFCFGRTDLDHEGLRRFKRGFGAEEYLLDYRRFDLSKNSFVLGAPKTPGHFSGFMRRIPLAGLKAVGLAYKHFG